MTRRLLESLAWALALPVALVGTLLILARHRGPGVLEARRR